MKKKRRTRPVASTHEKNYAFVTLGGKVIQITKLK